MHFWLMNSLLPHFIVTNIRSRSFITSIATIIFLLTSLSSCIIWEGTRSKSTRSLRANWGSSSSLKSSIVGLQERSYLYFISPFCFRDLIIDIQTHHVNIPRSCIAFSRNQAWISHLSEHEQTPDNQTLSSVRSVGIWVEQIVPHRLDVGMVLGL